MEVVEKKKFSRYLLEYIIITFASMINGVALFCFVNPAKLVAGGFSGISSVLTYVSCAIFPELNFETMMSVWYFVLNLPFLIVSLIKLRGDFTFKTIWATIVCSVTLAILPSKLVFNASRLICAIFGGTLMGLSMYVCSLYNGSNGGTEIVAKLVAVKHPERDLSNIITIANFATCFVGCVVLMVMNGESIWIVLYSLLFVIWGGEIMGIFSRGVDNSQKFLIVTSEYEQMSQEILSTFKRGLTQFNVETCPDEPKKKMIMVIVQYRQAHKLKQIIKKHDPQAFTFVKYVYDVFSRPGFNRSYKIK